MINTKRLIWGSLLLILIGLSVLAPLIVPADPLYAVSGESLRPPSPEHPLGTDQIGRDVLSRLLYGGHQTLTVATLAALIGILPGALIGVTIGTVGGTADAIGSTVIDALLAFPPLLLALALIALFGSGTGSIALAVGLAGCPVYARVARSAARVGRHQPYIEAARAIGARPARIILTGILPNAAPTLIGMGALLFSWALLNTAALAFLGFTSDPSTPDWGVMLAAGRLTLAVAPLQAIAPGLAITITVLAVNQLAATFTADRASL